jgi:hypothetical protein
MGAIVSPQNHEFTLKETEMTPDFQDQRPGSETSGEDFKPTLEGLQGTLQELRRAASPRERPRGAKKDAGVAIRGGQTDQIWRRHRWDKKSRTTGIEPMELVLQLVQNVQRDRAYLESIRDDVASWEETDRHAFYFADESLMELEMCLRRALVGSPTECERFN